MGTIVRQVNGRTTPRAVNQAGEVTVTREMAADPMQLSETLATIQGRVTEVKALAAGKWIEFEDVRCEATGYLVLAHKLGGRVRWWVVDWWPDVINADDQPALSNAISTTDDELHLVTRRAGTATIRVEKVGG